MKKLILLLGVGLCSHCHLRAQDADMFRVKAGQDASQVIPFDQRYHDGEFRQGKVSFYNGTSAVAKLNYNLLLGEMHFIDIKGDTLSLADEAAIKNITIGKELFYYDQQQGYVEKVADYGDIQLAVKEIMNTINSEKVGAYGQSTAVSSIKNYNTYSTGNSKIHKLEPKRDIILAKEKSYVLIDKNKRFYTAKKSSVLKIFPKHRKAIERYLQEASVDFNKEEDVRKLLQFCDELP